MNSENYRNMVKYKSNRLCDSTLSRDELQPDIHEVSVLLRDSILILENFVAFADENNFSDDIKFTCLFEIAQAYRLICLKNQKNVEANLQNSLPYIQRFVRILQSQPEILKNLKFMVADFVSLKLPEESQVDLLIDFFDDTPYIKKFRYY